MLKKGLLATSILLPLAAMSATANAGATISDARYWPSEARPAVHSGFGTVRSGPRDAFASTIVEPLQTPTNNGANAWRYHGGPKSPF
jgi:hypothetical protein